MDSWLLQLIDLYSGPMKQCHHEPQSHSEKGKTAIRLKGNKACLPMHIPLLGVRGSQPVRVRADTITLCQPIGSVTFVQQED